MHYHNYETCSDWGWLATAVAVVENKTEYVTLQIRLKSLEQSHRHRTLLFDAVGVENAVYLGFIG
jgi:hypothetical protein